VASIDVSRYTITDIALISNTVIVLYAESGNVQMENLTEFDKIWTSEISIERH